MMIAKQPLNNDNGDVRVEQEVGKSAAATAGVGYTIMGFPLSDIVATVTIIYVCLQIMLIAPKVYERYFGSSE